MMWAKYNLNEQAKNDLNGGSPSKISLQLSAFSNQHETRRHLQNRRENEKETSVKHYLKSPGFVSL